jgi:hypothetical protein
MFDSCRGHSRIHQETSATEQLLSLRPETSVHAQIRPLTRRQGQDKGSRASAMNDPARSEEFRIEIDCEQHLPDCALPIFTDSRSYRVSVAEALPGFD